MIIYIHIDSIQHIYYTYAMHILYIHYTRQRTYIYTTIHSTNVICMKSMLLGEGGRVRANEDR